MLPFSAMDRVPTYFIGQLILLKNPIHRIPGQFAKTRIIFHIKETHDF